MYTYLKLRLFNLRMYNLLAHLTNILSEIKSLMHIYSIIDNLYIFIKVEMKTIYYTVHAFFVNHLKFYHKFL